jgi:hypothetical protein
MEMTDQSDIPAHLLPGEEPGTTGYEGGLDVMAKRKVLTPVGKHVLVFKLVASQFPEPYSFLQEKQSSPL